jgi:2-haloalkanoic acid dehalogenase type II
MTNPKFKAILFDFMGTCLDWHSGTITALPQSIPANTRSEFALQWRQNYFDSNAARLAAKLPPEDIDLTLRRTLEGMLQEEKWIDVKAGFDDLNDKEGMKDKIVQAWHSMPPWPDVKPAISSLRASGYEVFVHANGTTRLQLDLCRSSGLTFDMLFSSELLGVYKPARENYEKVLNLLRLKGEECVLVAAHAYDTRGAKAVGMRTVYVHRWTDDIEEDMRIVKGENDAFLESMEGLGDAIARL